ncbi:uncharacterized protein EV422DRAFT_577983 [Fimicolochytrium jonesii]|uniref:uncharacterized protein n=1 Tax=Fimicolochytrium jonesii TaxID=1396493 RepID=UPI0022FE3461|nr:uncharacterized protein EV422DRAFT_577983 [Fimicolochytrium jonesii]KAI8821669.1 hypothetical protein EV422DRAFT_577983 [Fimicolochytrium jonesii]
MVQLILPTTLPSSHSSSSSTTTPPAWTLIELQGSLHTQQHESSDKDDLRRHDLAGAPLGRWRISQNGKTTYLEIGHHRLEGQRVPLKNPIAVLQKHLPSDIPPLKDEDDAEVMDIDEDDVEGDEMQRTPPPAPPPIHLSLEMSLDAGEVEVGSLPMDDDNAHGLSTPPPTTTTTTATTAATTREKIPKQQRELKPTYNVVTVLRHKYLFKARPEHLLAEEHKGLTGLVRKGLGGAGGGGRRG